jgi:hypothetical protein
MLHIVEVRRIGTDVETPMIEMQSWLEQHGVKPRSLEHSCGGPGITFRLRFHTPEEATAFARAFNGHCDGGDNPSGSPLWHIPSLG